MITDIKPLVSIVIPAFNAEKYIQETLDSVVNQTWDNIEIFVIDDGSKDRTVELARNYESAKLKVLTQPNSGACVARNKGLNLSKGRFIQYLDADDVLSTDKIESQVEVLIRNPGYVGISPSVHFMDGEDYHKIKPREESAWIFDQDDPVEFLVRLYGGYGQRWMVQTSAWLTPIDIARMAGPWDERLLLDQDGEYFARVVLASKGIRTTGGINYYRRFVGGSNISSRYNKKANLESALLALNSKASYLGARTNSQAYRQAMSTLYQEIAINAYPNFPDLVSFCEEKVAKTGESPALPVMGGSLIEMTKKLFGWKSAKRVRQLAHSITQKR